MVSIIVPVYNAQPFLERCVKSVLGQTYNDIQLILVDDGSVDSSGQICDAFAAEDNRILVIHQKNAGVSAARNAGLAAARGEYIGFVDADDTIAPDTYEKALKAIDGCDMVMWDAVTVWPDGKNEADTIDLLKTDCILQKKDWTPELLRQMAGAVWRCLYRRDLLENIIFPVGIKLSEDRLFNMEAMGKAKSLCYYKKALYFRSIEENSACHRYHGDKYEKSLVAMEHADRIIERYWSSEYRAVYVRAFVIDGALAAAWEICAREFPGKSRYRTMKALLEHKMLREAFDLCSPDGFWEKLLKKKMAIALLAAGFLRRIY